MMCSLDLFSAKKNQATINHSGIKLCGTWGKKNQFLETLQVERLCVCLYLLDCLGVVPMYEGK